MRKAFVYIRMRVAIEQEDITIEITTTQTVFKVWGFVKFGKRPAGGDPAGPSKSACIPGSWAIGGGFIEGSK